MPSTSARSYCAQSDRGDTLMFDTTAPNVVDDTGTFMFLVALADADVNAVLTAASPRAAAALAEWLSLAIGERSTVPTEVAAAAVPPATCETTWFSWIASHGGGVKAEISLDQDSFAVTVINQAGSEQCIVVSRDEAVNLRNWLGVRIGEPPWLRASDPARRSDGASPHATITDPERSSR